MSLLVLADLSKKGDLSFFVKVGPGKQTRPYEFSVLNIRFPPSKNFWV